jgi:hypothetical protein
MCREHINKRRRTYQVWSVIVWYLEPDILYACVENTLIRGGVLNRYGAS